MTKNACTQIVRSALLNLTLALAVAGCGPAEVDPASMSQEDRLSSIHRAISAGQAAPLGDGFVLHAESASFDESGALVLDVVTLHVPDVVVPWKIDSMILRAERSGLLASIDMTNTRDARHPDMFFDGLDRIGIEVEHLVYGPVPHER